MYLGIYTTLFTFPHDNIEPADPSCYLYTHTTQNDVMIFPKNQILLGYLKVHCYGHSIIFRHAKMQLVTRGTYKSTAQRPHDRLDVIDRQQIILINAIARMYRNTSVQQLKRHTFLCRLIKISLTIRLRYHYRTDVLRSSACKKNCTRKKRHLSTLFVRGLHVDPQCSQVN